MVFFLINYKL